MRLYLGIPLLLLTACAAGNAGFTSIQVDAKQAPWGKQIADLDGDGFPDVVEGGGYQLRQNIYWYHYPDWERHQLGSVGGDDDLQVGDINGDGALDVVVNGGLYWYENPRPKGASPYEPWPIHEIDAKNNAHDLVVGDVNGDGKPDVVSRGEFGPTHVYLQQGDAASWTRIHLTNASDGEGAALADVNLDGRVDVVENGFWLEQPSNLLTDPWPKRDFSPWPRGAAVAVNDINRDGRPDIFLSPSEVGAGFMTWFEGPADPIHDSWKRHEILPANDVHRFHLWDVNRDGELDIVFGEMHQSPLRRLGVLYNQGLGASWKTEIIATAGAHNLAIGDINNDGLIDIFTANWDIDSPGKGALLVWMNQGNPPARPWPHVQADSSRAKQAFGLTFADINADGRPDIVSGPYWYEGPKGDLTSAWKRFDLGAAYDAMLALDVDGDGRTDVIAEGDAAGEAGVYWLRPGDNPAGVWTAKLIGSMPADGGDFASQGYKLADVVPGGKPEVVLTSGKSAYYFQAPANPAAEPWPRVEIAPDVREEGIDFADMDGDGDLDLAGFRRPSGTAVAWWENPGNGHPDWNRHDIGVTLGMEGDRIALTDLNGDGRPDVIVTETNQKPSGNALLWFEHPASATAAHWTRRAIAVNQASLNSMAIGDVDHDGIVDIVTGEHRGDFRVVLWRTSDKARTWNSVVIDAGKESHLGAQLFDLDLDGDLDVVSIAWNAFQNLHIWRNDLARKPVAAVSVAK